MTMTTLEQHGWRLRGACRDADPALFVTLALGDEDDEPDYPPDEAHALCESCPVRVECLAYALRGEELVDPATEKKIKVEVRGVWGGTTTFQRRQLKRTLNRATCPGCSSDALVIEHGYEICLTCGLSWSAVA